MHLLLDIEGTITNDSGSMTGPEMIRAIRKLEKEGVPVIFCSGRDIAYMEELRRRWGLSPLSGAVAENGCVVAPFPEGIDGLVFDHRAGKLERDSILQKLSDLAGQIEMDPFKTSIFSLYVPGYLKGSSYTFSEVMGIFHMVSEKLQGIDCQIVPTSASVEILPTGVDKGTGIELYCRSSGLDPSEVMFIGDSNNDIPGARWVRGSGGRVGAISNSVPQLKEMAHILSGRPHWEGVLEVLKVSGIL